MAKLLVLLLLFACSTTSMKELEQQLVLCIEGGYLCAELQEEIERREKLQLNREQWEALTKCPHGYVFICRADWCTRAFRHGRKLPKAIHKFGSGCIHRDNIEWL